VGHPGDVTPVGSPEAARRGFDVLLPDGEFEALVAVVDGGASFDAYEVYSAVRGGVRFMAVVMLDEAAETAVLFPLYVRPGAEAAQELRGHAEEAGAVETHLRRLAGDRYVTFVHDDPSLFFGQGSEE
jgi:hypothetical protein